MTQVPEMKITALASWFGSNRMNAELPGRELAGCTHITVPFAGGMAEIPHMPPKAQLYVCDLHDDIINLAEIISTDEGCKVVASELCDRLFHPKTLADAQARIKRYRAQSGDGGLFTPSLDSPKYGESQRAADFFTCVWMGRGATAGSRSELTSGLALRSCGHGGDPVTRYRSAVESLQAWSQALRRCMFARESCWETIPRVRERAKALIKQDLPPKLGLYCDAPWPDDGDAYVHGFTEADQRRLATAVSAMPKGVRVVMRFGDHPLVRELYPESEWTWVSVSGRTQTNAKKAEVLLLNGPSYTGGGA